MCNLTRDEYNELDKYSFLRSWHRIGVTMAAELALFPIAE